jgi:hypothetical protein
MPGTVLMIVASILAGVPGTPPRPVPSPLPPLNAKVEAFARSNLGKTVGDGICITLAIEALEAAGARRGSFRDPKGDFTWGDPVPEFKDVLPGDILQFRDAVFRGKRPVGRSGWRSWHQEFPHHTAIVSKVEPGGKILTILHQNITTEGQPESEKNRVQETELRMDSLQKGGWVKAYRPIPPDPTRVRKPFSQDDSPGP